MIDLGKEVMWYREDITYDVYPWQEQAIVFNAMHSAGYNEHIENELEEMYDD